MHDMQGNVKESILIAGGILALYCLFYNKEVSIWCSPVAIMTM